MSVPEWSFRVRLKGCLGEWQGICRWKLTHQASLPAGAHKPMWYLMIYAAISGGQVLLELGRGFLSNYLAVRATRFLHASMLGRLLRCGGTQIRARAYAIIRLYVASPHSSDRSKCSCSEAAGSSASWRFCALETCNGQSRQVIALPPSMCSSVQRGR